MRTIRIIALDCKNLCRKFIANLRKRWRFVLQKGGRRNPWIFNTLIQISNWVHWRALKLCKRIYWKTRIRIRANYIVDTWRIKENKRINLQFLNLKSWIP